MLRKVSGALGTAVLAAGALVTTASPAAASGSLTLSLVSLTTGSTKTVTLTCAPTGGTHPRAEAACADLTAAGGDIARIPPMAGVGCLAVYLPVEARATGNWNGWFIQYSRTFSNGCVANVSTGGDIFYF